MAFLAIRVSAWQALPTRAKRVIRFVFERLDLRQREQTDPPPIWLNPGGVEHYIFHDLRFTPSDATALAVVAKNADNLPNPDNAEGNEITKAEMRALLAAAIQANTPPSIPEGVDPYSYRLTYAAAPAAVQMFSDIPDGWSPKVAE